MELKIICQDKTLEDLIVLANTYFGTGIKAIPMKNSMFEQYEIRAIEHVWIKNCYKYRIVHKDSEYFLGELLT
jgi:hypothetical protein